MDLLASNYWRDTFFDGLGSTLIGAALAVAGIWLTLRHDRGLVRESHVFEVGQHLIDASTRILEMRADSRVDSFECRVQIEYMNVLIRFNGLVTAKEPCLSALLATARQNLEKRPAAPEGTNAQTWDWVYTSAEQIRSLVQTRLTEPDRFRKMNKKRCDEVIGFINRGVYVDG